MLKESWKTLILAEVIRRLVTDTLEKTRIKNMAIYVAFLSLNQGFRNDFLHGGGGGGQILIFLRFTSQSEISRCAPKKCKIT